MRFADKKAAAGTVSFAGERTWRVLCWHARGFLTEAEALDLIGQAFLHEAEIWSRTRMARNAPERMGLYAPGQV